MDENDVLGVEPLSNEDFDPFDEEDEEDEDREDFEV